MEYKKLMPANLCVPSHHCECWWRCQRGRSPGASTPIGSPSPLKPCPEDEETNIIQILVCLTQRILELKIW